MLGSTAQAPLQPVLTRGLAGCAAESQSARFPNLVRKRPWELFAAIIPAAPAHRPRRISEKITGGGFSLCFGVFCPSAYDQRPPWFTATPYPPSCQKPHCRA